MAIEDAASLSVVLPRGTKPGQVEARLELYERIRRDRAHRIQEFSRQAGQDWVEGHHHVDNTDYNYGFDEVDNTSKHLSRWLWAQSENVSWQSPIGFGPCPGPLQDGLGRPWLSVPDAGHAQREFTTLNIRFQTSRTLVEKMFPTDQFQFRRADTVCTASWSVTKLGRGTPWLGGVGAGQSPRDSGGSNEVEVEEGYCTAALFIHGVRYAKKDGGAVNGAFVPVLFESLGDAVVSGREHLGLPKFACDVGLELEPEPDTDGSSSCRSRARATVAWRGTRFLELTLPSLREADDPSSETALFGESNVLAYRYVPAVGEPGKADAEYACVVTHADEGRVQSGGARLSYAAHSDRATVDCRARDWDTLPTLHHVASALAEIPVYKTLHARLVKGVVAADMPRARRIE